MIGFAHSGVAANASASGLTITLLIHRSSSLGTGIVRVAGSLSSLLSNTRNSVRNGISSMMFRRDESHRCRIISSGISCPPEATRARTRAICCSGVDSPANQITIWSPASAASRSRRGIVLPPSVDSNAKLDRASIADSSRSFPSCQAAAFASSTERPVADLIRRATSSGLK